MSRSRLLSLGIVALMITIHAVLAAAPSRDDLQSALAELERAFKDFLRQQPEAASWKEDVLLTVNYFDIADAGGNRRLPQTGYRLVRPLGKGGMGEVGEREKYEKKS